MTLEEQISTMMTENMQRSDLTVYEEAEGFQMMMDFGNSVEQVADKAGFSESTIRRRVKLLSLDREEFKKSVKRGATLADFALLDKLDTHGSEDFKIDKDKEFHGQWETLMKAREEYFRSASRVLLKDL